MLRCKNLNSKKLFSFVGLFFCILFIGCFQNQTKEPKSLVSHVDDYIDLSFYGVKLGDSIDNVLKIHPNAYFVPLDSLEEYLPIKQSSALVYEQLGISVYAIDTTFIVNHKLRKKKYTRNGSPINFDIDYSEHGTIFAFFILDGRVCQNELFINTPYSYESEYFPVYQWGETCLEMFRQKYGECDSLLFYNNSQNKSVVLSINASDEEIKEAIDYCGTDIHHNNSHAYIWQWKNAQLLFQYNYNDFHIKFNYHNFYNVCRIICYDLIAYERKKEQMILNQLNEANRKQEEFDRYQNYLYNELRKQDF